MPSANRERRLSDPLANALLPPADETPKQRDLRLEAERAAKKISDDIDEQLKAEKESRKQKLRRQKEVKVLLLGQSESGKSTTLKQFQLAYTPNAFREERLAWRSVVYLNLVRSVRRIVDTFSLPEDGVASDNITDSEASPSAESNHNLSEAYDEHPSGVHPSPPPPLASPRYAALRSRLAPLFSLEARLIQQLAGSDDDEATQLAWPAPISSPPVPTVSPLTERRSGELSITHRNNWKKALNKLAGSGRRSSISSPEVEFRDPSDPAYILNRCQADIEELWGDPAVQEELRRRRIRLEESSGFYLDSLSRITSLNYIPSDDDVLKARIKTLGVVEHTFSLETGQERGVDWKIYDVGGARSQRQAWAPYFEDMNAIIFLAPISAFDQVLAEDPRVNRVEDSLLLWRSLVANKLLSKVNIVLFLNKCDLLKTKLEAGVRLNQYMTSYGDRPNNHEAVSKYFRSKFLALHQSYSPNLNREVYLHLTAVTDTRRTSSILMNVRDIILRDDLREIKLL